MGEHGMDIELIEWLDSHIEQGGWRQLDDEAVFLPVMLSVGYVIKEDDTAIMVCPHISFETEQSAYQGCGLMTIPKSAVQKRSKATFSS